MSIYRPGLDQSLRVDLSPDISIARLHILFRFDSYPSTFSSCPVNQLCGGDKYTLVLVKAPDLWLSQTE